MFPSACSFIYVGFHCLSLHISAYMAIFRCVGYFYFHIFKDSASLSFFHVVTLCMFSICVLFLCCFLRVFFFCLSVCLQTKNKDRASRQTHTQENDKNNEGKQHRKHTNGLVVIFSVLFWFLCGVFHFTSYPIGTISYYPCCT
jgi:Na+/melibiose symporter-like transporter